MIPTGGSLSEALKFYTEKLGFSVVWENSEMAGVRRGSVSFNLVTNSSREWAFNSSYSIGVSALESLYREYQDHGVSLGTIELQPWERREFHIIVPSGVSLQFYEQKDSPLS